MARTPICKEIEKFNLKTYLKLLNCLDRESINSIKKEPLRDLYGLLYPFKKGTPVSPTNKFFFGILTYRARRYLFNQVLVDLGVI